MLALLYHNILTVRADGLPVADGQVTLETFRRHIARVRRHLVHPEEVHEQLVKGRMPKGVIVTFDDGAAGVLDAARVLAEVGAVGVAFVCPGAIQARLWFYKLADILTRSTISRLKWRYFDLSLNQSAERIRAYKALSIPLFDLAPTMRDGFLDEIEDLVKPTNVEPHPALTTLDEAGMHQVAATGGMVFANHSWSHPNLVMLNQADLLSEIADAHDWLNASRLPALPWFAFPRGIYNSSVAQRVRRFCPVLFGASAREREFGVLPRTYVCEADARRLRFFLKTAQRGRLRRALFI